MGTRFYRDENKLSALDVNSRVIMQTLGRVDNLFERYGLMFGTDRRRGRDKTNELLAIRTFR